MSIVHDPNNWFKESGQEFDIFQYAYQFSLKDKVYASTLQDKSIIDSYVDSETLKHNNYLAGDIQRQFKITNQDIISRVEKELAWHISNVFKAPVSDIDLNSDLWINYQQATEYNPSHYHLGKFSFVIYADIDQSIREEHNQSAGNAKTRGLIQFTSQLTNDTMLFNPSKYTILIFEASHLHQVYPFYSNNTRISIAGNVKDFNLGNL
jgi:hypothetical protein